MAERGATEEEVASAIAEGERFTAKFGRSGFGRNFVFDRRWRGRHYHMMQVEAYATWEEGDRFVISVLVKYF